MLLYISDQCIFVVVVVYFWLRHWCCIFVVVIEVYQDFYNTSHAIWCWKLRYKIFYAYEKSINEMRMLRWMNGNIKKDHTKWRNSIKNRGDSWMKKWKRGGVFETIWSCAEQLMQCISEEKWFIQVKRIKRIRGRQKRCAN